MTDLSPETRWPHERIKADFYKYFIKTGVLKRVFIGMGFAMLIFVTAVTTMLFLALPNEPRVFNGCIAGLGLICFIGLGCHLMVFERGRS